MAKQKESVKRLRIFKKGLYLGILSLLFVLVFANFARAGWDIQTVDTVGRVGMRTSIALDKNNYPHILNCDIANDSLKYAKWNGSSWNIQTIESANVTWRSSLALDGNGYPHISYAYWNGTTGVLKYAKWNGSSWDKDIVDSGACVWCNSIALDGNNYPHIAYYDENSLSLKYAKWTGSSWDIQTVAGASSLGGQEISMALDSNYYPHISYIADGLEYAKWTGSSWVTQVIDNSVDVVYDTSIDLDSNDYAHISYYERTTWSLRYAKWTGSSWSIEVVDEGPNKGDSNWIVLDTSDRPHISYLDYLGANYSGLNYAYWTGSSWNIETIESSSQSPGYYTSITLDTSDYPHIAYCAYANMDLKYAKWTVPQIDLIITNVDAPSSATERDTINVSYMMKNQGNTLAGSFYIYFYLSLDTTINPSQDTKFGECYVSALSAGPGITDITSCALPSGLTGSYYVGAIIDATGSVSESNENNNTGYDPTRIDISPAPPGPDLVVVSIDAPSSATAGDSVNVWNTIKNEGDASANSFYIYFYLSTNTTIIASDTKIGERYVSSLSAGASSSASSYLTLPSGVTGSYYVGAIVDAIGSVSESNENNNTGYDPTPIDISPGPNLQVSHSYLDFGEIPKGQTKTKTFTISNSGAGTLSGAITTDRSWISASPTSFDSNSITASVTVYTDTLEVWKTYTGTVTVDSNGGVKTVNVSIIPTCVKSYPNPYSLSSGKPLMFWGTGVPHTTIKIYTLSGELVKTLKETKGEDKITWDGRNEDGDRVVRGIYFFTTNNPREKNRGKFTVVR